MSDAELAKFKGTRKVYMRSIDNTERDTLDIIKNFKLGDENQITKLISAKTSLNEKLIKVREFDNHILELLNQEESESELENILVRDDKINELIVKIERCIYKSSHENISTSSSVSANISIYISTNSNNQPTDQLKVNLPELVISKFQGDIIEW